MVPSTGSGLERSSSFDRLRPGLNRGIGVEGDAFRFETLSTKFLDHLRRFRIAARIGVRRKHDTLRGRAGDMPKVLRL
jgi:hypothetical protein